MNFLSMIGVIVLAVIAYNLLPLFFSPLIYHSDTFGIIILMVATILVVILARKSNDDFQKGKLRKFQENFESKTWAWILSILLLIFLFPVDSYVDDGFMLSILIIGLFVLWGYLMRNLAQISVLEFMKKKFVFVVIGLAAYLAIGGVYSTYRWVKFVPTYIAKANKEETLIRNRDKVANQVRSDEEVRKEVERWAGTVSTCRQLQGPEYSLVGAVDYVCSGILLHSSHPGLLRLPVYIPGQPARLVYFRADQELEADQVSRHQPRFQQYVHAGDQQWFPAFLFTNLNILLQLTNLKQRG
jgi:hypothetical protein